MSTLPQIDSHSFAFPSRDQAANGEPDRSGVSPMDSAVAFNRMRRSFLSDIAALPRPSRGYFVTKRIIDLTIALAIGILVLPIALLIAIAIPLNDRGAIFFRQQRTGLGGRRFTMLKFRTMCTNAEEMKAELQHLSLVAYPDFKMDNDPRITKVGRFLRATFLDELPQLINVIRGEMSLVGPRPPRSPPAPTACGTPSASRRSPASPASGRCGAERTRPAWTSACASTSSTSGRAAPPAT